MTDDWMCLALVSTVLVTGYFCIRFCAEACLHGKRRFWIKAVYLAQQRAEYREFVKGLDEAAELAAMMRNEEQ